MSRYDVEVIGRAVKNMQTGSTDIINPDMICLWCGNICKSDKILCPFCYRGVAPLIKEK